MRSASRILAVVAIALLVAACGSTTASPSPSPSPSTRPPTASGVAGCSAAPDPGAATGWGQPTTKPSIVPVLINESAELTCGANRLLFSFVDAASNAPVGKPDRTASVAIFDLARDPAKPVATADGTFIWAIENERGIYVANVSFPEAGVWGAEFTTSAGRTTEKVRVTFQVSPTTPVVRVADKAPPTKTPTAADVGGDVTKISTDKTPDKALYQTSVDAAIAKHEPFLLVFATPKFCQSAQCGPTLDRIKPFVSKYPSVKFIHVEPYKLTLTDGQLQPVLTNNNLTPIDAVQRWGLLSEPWVFVVDRDGIVRGSFELMFSDAELTSALNAVK